MTSRHRPVSPRQRASFASRLLMPVMIAGLLFAGLVVYAIVQGELRLPFGGGVLFAFPRQATAPAGVVKPEGTVPVLACPRELPAFTRITREHLLTANGLHSVPVVEGAIAANGLFRTDNEGVQRLLGRVLRRDKAVNFAFTEKDLLPEGTRPGPSAGIPPGKRGVWIDLGKVQGLAAVQAGDHVDLVAARSEPANSAIDTDSFGNVTDPVIRTRIEALRSTVSKGATPRSWVIARDAVVITPKRSRDLTPGGSPRGKPAAIDEVFLAMAPNEVALLSQALAQDVAILSAPRSGQPESTPTEIEDSKPVDAKERLRQMLTGDDGAESSLRVVEVIRGGERGSVTVPRAKTESGER